MRITIGKLVAASFLATSFLVAPASANEVNLYTTREAQLVKPLTDAFTAKTGIKVNTIFVKDGLAERVAAEGTASPADVLLTVDIGNIVDAVDKGVTQPVKSDVLTKTIPANLRDKADNWFAISVRARIFYAAKDKPNAPATYEDMADPKYKGKICIRSGQHPYNTALVAAYIDHYGEAKTEEWLKAVKANLARKPAGGDREVARDILAGICDFGVANSYYVGLMRAGKGGPDQQKWGDGISVVLPKFKDGGTHVNVAVAAVAKNAPHKAEAVKFLEFALTDEAQALFAKANFEFPVKAGAEADPHIAQMGALTPDRIDLATIAKTRKAAANLIDKAGFDQ